MAKIGDIAVVPEGTKNPYKSEQIIGKLREELLRKFLTGEETAGYEFWDAPICGGAKKLRDKEEARVDQEFIDYLVGRSK